MKSISIIPVAALLLVAGVAPRAEGDNVRSVEITREYFGLAERSTDHIVSHRIDLGGGENTEISGSVTTRGNGTLRVSNLSLRVWDDYDDGYLFQDTLLKVVFTDLDGDGFKDLVVSGVGMSTGEKETNEKHNECICSIYHYDKQAREFTLRFRTGPDLAN